MWSHLWLTETHTARRRPSRVRTRCPCRQRSAGHKLYLEHLEDRSLLSGGGVTPSLAALGNETPLPIALPIALAASPFGGPDIYQNFQGPADGPPGFFGNEPNQITNFEGLYGGARIQGTGTDNSGNTFLWDADLRFMKGFYQALDGKLYHRTFVEV